MKAQEKRKKISVVLHDCGFREHFITPIYLNRQNIPRDDYEIVWVELYDKIKPELAEMKKQGIVDKVITLNQPRTTPYRRQLILNPAILESEGEIVCFMDADTLCLPTILSSIINAFEQFEKIVLYIDEVRHAVIEEIIAMNYPVLKATSKRTRGMKFLEDHMGTPFLKHNDIKNSDPYSRNYGACFSAFRKDLISIGGADETEEYDGAFGGPFEMGWRLLNRGFKEYWHPHEYIVHVWHPGTDGTDITNLPSKLNPDGHMNLCAFRALEKRTVYPIRENEKIKTLRLEMEEQKKQNE